MEAPVCSGQSDYEDRGGSRSCTLKRQVDRWLLQGERSRGGHGDGKGVRKERPERVRESSGETGTISRV